MCIRDRPHGVWGEPCRASKTNSLLRGQDPQGYQARRPTSGATDEVRTGDQYEDREGSGPEDPAICVAPSRRDHRTMIAPRTLEPACSSVRFGSTAGLAASDRLA